MHLSKDLRAFIESLNSNRVELLVVGAFAVAWHGWPRFTSDIDVFLRSSEENARAAVLAIDAFGLRSLGITEDDLMRSNQVVQIGAKPNRIDLITSISGVSFEDAWAHKVRGSVDGVPVFFIGRGDPARPTHGSTGGKPSKRSVNDLEPVVVF